MLIPFLKKKQKPHKPPPPKTNNQKKPKKNPKKPKQQYLKSRITKRKLFFSLSHQYNRKITLSETAEGTLLISFFLKKGKKIRSGNRTDFLE